MAKAQTKNQTHSFSDHCSRNGYKPFVQISKLLKANQRSFMEM